MSSAFFTISAFFALPLCLSWLARGVRQPGPCRLVGVLRLWGEFVWHSHSCLCFWIFGCDHKRAAFAAIAPAAAPMANHFAARAILRNTDPPLAARRASSRSLPSAWLFTFSSARSA